MKLVAFAYYDAKAGVFSQPLFYRAVGEAIRDFGDQCANPESPFHKHPHDYTLHQVGEYDPFSGDLMPLTPPVEKARALDYNTDSNG